MNRRQLLQGLAALALVGCGSDTVQSSLNGSGPTLLAPTFLLSAQAAEILIRSGALLLAADSIHEAHRAPLLGGALRVDVDALTTLTEQPDGLTQVSALQAFFRALGVDETVPVVVYDDGEMKFAARVRFLLGYCGLAPSWIVNGGAPALQSLLPAGGGLAAPSVFLARITNSPIALVFQQDVLAALGSGVKILDVRTPEEFSGQKLLPGDARPGHIPGARNVPVETFFSQGLIVSNEALRVLFAAAGLAPGDTLIVYCHDGAKSSLAATLLVQCGFSQVNLYYLSYQDWSQNPALPVEV
jgi:thiosulfate/3-mercaptopyruvate sulfurtransferase